MKKVLEKIYGKKLEGFSEEHLSLPLYLQDGRRFFKVSIAGHSFVIVFLTMGTFHVQELKKQLLTYQSCLKGSVVYGFDKVSFFQRKSMIENDIPFIASNGQMFLPFMGVYFEKCAQNVESPTERFMPVTQLLYLLFLYGNDSYTKSDAAKRIHVSAMSVTRAAKQLVANGLINEKKLGTEVWMSIVEADRKVFYERGKNYLINPIQGKIYIPNARENRDTPSAGEFSLSQRTDLGYPEYIEYAFYKDDPGIQGLISINPNYEASSEIARIQKWKYDPKIFSCNGMVDPVSLICSLRGTSDERVHKCLEQVEKEIWKWQRMLN